MSILAEVQAVGAVCAATGPQEEALANVAGGESFIQRHPVFVGLDGQMQLGGFAEGCLEEVDTISRILWLMNSAYMACMDRLPTDVEAAERWRLIIALPVWLEKVEDLREDFLQRVRTMNFERVRKVDFIFGDKVAGFHALERAAKALETEDRVLWACADTLVAPVILDARAMAGLAALEGDPYKVIPGEGAAMFLLGKEGISDQLPIARLRGVATGGEEESISDDNRGILGRTSVEIIRAVHADLAHGAQPGAYLCDFNGERHRAEELGTIMSTFAGQNEAIEDPIVPFTSLGDAGAATAGLFAALVPHLGQLPTQHVLITAAENGGDRAAALFDKT